VARTLAQQYDDLDAHIALQEARILQQYGQGEFAARCRELEPLYAERNRLRDLVGAAATGSATASRRNFAQFGRPA